jgi:hypothetical protein
LSKEGNNSGARVKCGYNQAFGDPEPPLIHHVLILSRKFRSDLLEGNSCSAGEGCAYRVW